MSHPQQPEHATLPALLDALDDVIVRARPMPMSASVLVNKPEALELIDQMREAMPAQLSQADEYLTDADQRLADAEAQAEQIIAQARERAAQLVAAEQIVRQAEARAREIVQQGQREADELRSEADDYCDRRLAEFEIDLGKVVAQVQAGRAKLADRLAERDD
ncbi:hypothetical protein GCM10011331_12850 [Flavimobilis marinus]|uniref:Cell division septum initiation DivIVA, interacts with FtsZ, MinD n=1 Tax=Flavimobilis marinus TaxID=285351 RepID=A0A1I2G210_9MICO|nr:hypothetical protein [Flavimobilis marinus]GHG50299.1 hypothetical protein GCM10011331_12850 [Flavimobilis marinus]SFF11705.1 hypothetical protein SAMN04488035_1684 [Flavimobilis marinus]